jgi:hypothetical protein
MKTFLQWVDDNKLTPELKEASKRSGLSWWQMPSSAVRAHYPPGYFMASNADAMQKMGYADSKTGKMPNDKAPSDDAP